jgi:hypothetical protein
VDEFLRFSFRYSNCLISLLSIASEVDELFDNLYLRRQSNVAVVGNVHRRDENVNEQSNESKRTIFDGYIGSRISKKLE